MKVVVIGDAHLGAGYSFGKPHPITGINSRLNDYEKTLSDIIYYVIENKIELVVFLGDIFETRHPTPSQVSAFYRQTKRLSDAGITTYIIVGNHDYYKSRKMSSSLDPLKELNIPYIYVFNEITLRTFTNSYNEKVNILLMPYRNRQSYDKDTTDEAIAEMRNEIVKAKNTAIDNVPILLAGHMMVQGTINTDYEDAGLNELVLPYDMFEGIDVVINGHIHRSSVLSEDPLIIYSGSIECKDFSERTHNKCFLVYDTNKAGTDAITFKPIKTRQFIDFDLDYVDNLPEKPMDEIFALIQKEPIKDAVVRFKVKVSENNVQTINLDIIKAKFQELGASCISDVSISPLISKHLRNQKVNAAPDDVSAFKHYIEAQTNVNEEVMEMGLEIIRSQTDI